MKKEIIRKRMAYLGPLLLAIVCYAVCIRFGGMKYHTNDDTAIQSTLAGLGMGTPYPVHQFINILISYPLSWLYRIIPRINWWFFYSHMLTFTGLFIVNQNIRFLAERNHFPLFPAFCLMLLIDSVFFILPISYIAFTIVAGTIGTGAVALLIVPWGKYRKTQITLVCVLYILAVCHRSESGKVIACYLMLTMLYKVLCNRPERDHAGLPAAETEDRNRRIPGRWICILAAMILLYAGTYALTEVNRTVQNRINGEDFVRFNSARSSFMDFPVDSYEENPQIYQDVGWDETTYLLVKNHWCFLDDAVNTENFRYLVRNSRTERRTADLEMIVSRWDTLVKKEPNTKGIGWVWLVISAAALISVVMNWERKRFLIWLLNTVGTAALVFYQLYAGRIFYRTVIICLLPSALIHLSVLMDRLGGIGRRRICYLVAVLTLIFCLPATVEAISPAFDPAEKEAVISAAAKERALKQYTQSHKETVFIRQTQMTTNRSPVRSVSDGKATNIIGWGGSGFYSKVNRLILEANGITKLNGDLFRRDNVRLISPTNIIGKDNQGKKMSERIGLVLFYKWMKQKYQATGLMMDKVVCRGVYIYKVLFDKPNDNETAYDYADGEFVLIQ